MCSWGQLGKGKSLAILYEAERWKLRNPNCTIYSNFPLTIDHVKINDPEIIFGIKKDSIVLLDELWHMANSRTGMSLINDIMTMLLIRSRKKHWFVGYTQQHFKQTDLRIRYVTEVWIEPEMGPTHTRLRYYTCDGKYLGERYIKSSDYWNDYLSEEDPYTLDIEAMKKSWERHKHEY